MQFIEFNIGGFPGDPAYLAHLQSNIDGDLSSLPSRHGPDSGVVVVILQDGTIQTPNCGSESSALMMNP